MYIYTCLEKIVFIKFYIFFKKILGFSTLSTRCMQNNQNNIQNITHTGLQTKAWHSLDMIWHFAYIEQSHSLNVEGTKM